MSSNSITSEQLVAAEAVQHDAAHAIEKQVRLVYNLAEIFCLICLPGGIFYSLQIESSGGKGSLCKSETTISKDFVTVSWSRN